MGIKVLLIQGGPSNEHEVSLNSGRMIFSALDRNKYDISTATITKDGLWIFDGLNEKFYASDAFEHIKQQGFDVAFIALHGKFGEDGQIQALLDNIKLPYTGSNPKASALAMNKAKSAAIFTEAGLLVPQFRHIQDENLPEDILFPAIVKPCHGGSSVNVSIVADADEAKTKINEILSEGDSVIIQELINGREFTCGVLDDENGIPDALPPTEIIPKKGGLFDYESKYVAGASDEITPPDILHEQIVTLQNYALRAHKMLGCSGMSRSDFLLRDGTFYILETNTIPGMIETSLLPQEAMVAGISFSQMLDRIIASGLRRKD